MLENKWSCEQCGGCCLEPMLFSAELKDKISKIYPELRWVLIPGSEHAPFYQEEKSLETGKCSFLQTGPDGKKKCGIYEFRPPICQAYGDNEYILYICDKNPKFDPTHFAKEDALVEMEEDAAMQRYHKANASLFSK